MENKADSREVLMQSLYDLLIAVVKGLKVLLVYIIPSALVAVLVSPQLQEVVKSNPSLLLYAPTINVALSVIATLIKQRLPEESNLRKAL